LFRKKLTSLSLFTKVAARWKAFGGLDRFQTEQFKPQVTLPTAFNLIKADSRRVTREMVTSAVPVIQTSDLREEDAQKYKL